MDSLGIEQYYRKRSVPYR